MKDSQPAEAKEVHNLGSPGIYTILRGEAPPQKDQTPVAISITGRLSAPFDFLEHKFDPSAEDCLYEPVDAHLIVDKENGKLDLKLNEKNRNSADTITGTLSLDKNTQDWGINTTKRWTVASFLQFIRERKYQFKDPTQQGSLLSSLKKWEVNVERVIKQHNDNTGNSIDSLETKVSKVEGLITQFTLEVPIYKGYQKMTFGVEIGLDPKSTSVELYLVSPDLFELIQTQKEALFSSELEKFKTLKFDCSIVNIS